MKRIWIATSLALLLGTPSTGVAAVIYEEVTPADDLPIDPPYPVLPLALGANSVVGFTSFSSDAVDSFAFSVPAGLELASIDYVFTISSFARGSATLTQAVSGLSLVSGDGSQPQPGSLLDVQNVDMVPGLCSILATPPCGPSSANAVTVALFEDVLPVGPGIYSLEQRALTVNDPQFVTWNAQYRVDLFVVPEAGTLLLLGPALGTLVVLTRSRPRAL